MIVGVGVDDDVGFQAQACLESGKKRAGEALMSRQYYHVMYAMCARNRGGGIRASVVDDQPFDLINAWDFNGQAGQRDREGLLLVVAGNLDYQLGHRPVGVRRESSALASKRMVIQTDCRDPGSTGRDVHAMWEVSSKPQLRTDGGATVRATGQGMPT